MTHPTVRGIVSDLSVWPGVRAKSVGETSTRLGEKGSPQPFGTAATASAWFPRASTVVPRGDSRSRPRGAARALRSVTNIIPRPSVPAPTIHSQRQV